MNHQEELLSSRYQGPLVIKKKIYFGIVGDGSIEFVDDHNVRPSFVSYFKHGISFDWFTLLVKTLEDLGFDVCVDFVEYRYFYQTE